MHKGNSSDLKARSHLIVVVGMGLQKLKIMSLVDNSLDGLLKMSFIFQFVTAAQTA